MTKSNSIRILQRERGSGEMGLAQELHPLLARIYSARGITGVDELDLSLSKLLHPHRSFGC